MKLSTALGNVGSAIGSVIDASTLAKLRKELTEAEPVADAAAKRVTDLKMQIEAIQKRLSR